VTPRAQADRCFLKYVMHGGTEVQFAKLVGTGRMSNVFLCLQLQSMLADVLYMLLNVCIHYLFFNARASVKEEGGFEGLCVLCQSSTAVYKNLGCTGSHKRDCTLLSHSECNCCNCTLS
jgi:hypothetical protein